MRGNDSNCEQSPSLRTTTYGDHLLDWAETECICLIGRVVLGPTEEQAASQGPQP